MKTKHTQVEWTTEECSNGGLIVCLGDKKDYSVQRVQIVNEQNAKLIAAAPELLEALQNLENDDNSIPEHAWDMVKKAIKKATE